MRRRYLRAALRSVVLYTLTMAAVVVVVFTLPRAMPGDPLSALDDPDNSVYVTDPVVRDKVRADYGPVGEVLDVAKHLVLPAGALTLSLLGTKFLLVRNTMISALGADYMVLARAKGLPDRLLKYRHAGRNALLPFLTVVGIQAGLPLAAPWLSSYRTTELAGSPLEPPGATHWLGTNGVGQDLASQLLSGARVS